MEKRDTKEDIARIIFDANVFAIHDVDNGEEPFPYTSGDVGPGYIMLRDLLGQPRQFRRLTKALTYNVLESGVAFDFVNGNRAEGIAPAWQMVADLEEITGKEYPYTYQRSTRKVSGYGEIITGLGNNPLIKPGDKPLLVEELTNYAMTIVTSANIFKMHGHPVEAGACFVNFEHEDNAAILEHNDLRLISLITVPELLDFGEEMKYLKPHLAQSFRDYLKDSKKWQKDRGYNPPN